MYPSPPPWPMPRPEKPACPHVLTLPLTPPTPPLSHPRLYLVTRNPEPYLPPDAASLVSVTNFTVTRSGLEGRLVDRWSA